jgi:hypothetical protein
VLSSGRTVHKIGSLYASTNVHMSNQEANKSIVRAAEPGGMPDASSLYLSLPFGLGGRN